MFTVASAVLPDDAVKLPAKPVSEAVNVCAAFADEQPVFSCGLKMNDSDVGERTIALPDGVGVAVGAAVGVAVGAVVGLAVAVAVGTADAVGAELGAAVEVAVVVGATVGVALAIGVPGDVGWTVPAGVSLTAGLLHAASDVAMTSAVTDAVRWTERTMEDLPERAVTLRRLPGRSGREYGGSPYVFPCAGPRPGRNPRPARVL